MFIIIVIGDYLKRCENNVYKYGKAVTSHFVHFVTVNRRLKTRIHSVSSAHKITKLMSAGMTHYRKGREKREASYV